MPTKRELRKIREMEQEIAADLGGRRVPLSGAGAEKCDGRVRRSYDVGVTGARETKPGYRIEVKSTDASVYRLSARTWHLTAKTAMKAGETPLLCVVFNRLSKLYVLPTNAYLSLWGVSREELPAPVREGARSFSVVWDDVSSVECTRVVFTPQGLVPWAYDVCIVDYRDALERLFR